MCWAIVALLPILWLLRLVGSVAGGLIHLLPIVALMVLVAQLLRSRRTT